VIQKERNKIANFDSMVSSGTNKGNTLTEYSAITFTQIIATSQIHQGDPDFTQIHPQVTNWLDSLLKDVTSVV
jgi:hypothetical protein